MSDSAARWLQDRSTGREIFWGTPRRHGLDEDPPRCHQCGHPFDDGCGCTCCYDYDDDESTGYPQDVET